MNDKIEAIILKQQDYRDYDVILTAYSKQFGKMSFLASGIRKMTSKNASSLLPMTLAEIQYDHKPNKTMFRLKTARTIQLFRHLHENLELSTAGDILCETVDKMTMAMDEDLNADMIYPMLNQALMALDQNSDSKTIVFLFLVEMMQIYGISPVVDGCAICGESKVVSISAKEGGFLCEGCAKAMHANYMQTEDLKRFRVLVKAGFRQYQAIIDNIKAKMDDLNIITDIINQYSGFTIHAIGLYSRLFGIE